MEQEGEVISGILGLPGGRLEPSWKKVTKKTSKDNFEHPILGGRFEVCSVKNLIWWCRFSCLILASLSNASSISVLGFWNHFGVQFGFILNIFFADDAKLHFCNLSQAKPLVLRGPASIWVIFSFTFCWLLFAMRSGWFFFPIFYGFGFRMGSP